LLVQAVPDPVREFEVLDHVESQLGVLILRERSAPVPGVLELSLEHQLLMSSAVTVSECELATRAIAMHGGTDLDVVIGGLGLGYTSKAALASGRVARVEVVELVQGIIDWVARGVIPLGTELMADARFHTTCGDVFERLCGPARTTHDLLLIDVDHSPDERLGESSDSFYAHANLVRAARHLRPGGVFALWSTSENPAFEVELRQTFADVAVEPIEFFNETVGEDETNWLFLAKTPR
jgi:spermidine synthase